jgi:enoyl-CoA hydratase/carnithine racemase
MPDGVTSAGLQVSAGDGLVGSVVLCRPPYNYLDTELLAGLVAEVGRLAADGVRAVVLSAEGRCFSAGADMSAGGLGGGAEAARAAFYEQVAALFTFDVPVIAAIGGPAIGGGLGLALACDIRIASPEARFAANFSRFGYFPGFALTVTLPALVGPGSAADLLLTGRRVDGEAALAAGLVRDCVPAADLLATAAGVANEIATAGPLAVSAIRTTLRAGLADAVRRALEHEHEQQSLLRQTTDFAEGLAALQGRRPARFTGR